ncbi:hypothetical protein ACSSS7_001930 [Eimeria intestinalis]
MESPKRSPSPQKLHGLEKAARLAAEEFKSGVSKESRDGSFGGVAGKLTSAVSSPFSFFQSRAEIRPRGEASKKDPSVQPRAEGAPKDYGSGLPGYPKDSCLYFDRPLGRSKYAPEFVSLFTLLDVHDNRLPGPRLNGFPRCKVDYPALPTDKLGTPTYDYRDLLSYRMDYHPYVVRSLATWAKLCSQVPCFGTGISLYLGSWYFSWTLLLAFTLRFAERDDDPSGPHSYVCLCQVVGRVPLWGACSRRELEGCVGCSLAMLILIIVSDGNHRLLEGTVGSVGPHSESVRHFQLQLTA